MPERTCIGCRSVASQDALARMVADHAGRIRIDGSRRGPGRGAYVHPSRACVERAARRDSIGRAFKRNIVTISGDALLQLLPLQQRLRAEQSTESGGRPGSTRARPSEAEAVRQVEVEQSGTRIREHE